MVGPSPEAMDTYKQRSPIEHTEKLSWPILLLQGLEDKVVPPNQSQAMAAVLKKNQVPHQYITFEERDIVLENLIL